jgi:hypothetical protein
MHVLARCRAGLVVAGCISLMLPSQLGAQLPQLRKQHATRNDSSIEAVRDVRLAPHETLRGVVYSAEGHLMAGKAVVLAQSDQELQQTTTDKEGRFAFRGLRGGLYWLTVDRSSQVFRVWTEVAAPPHALTEVVLVSGGVVRRGQHPFGELFVCNPIVLGLIIAAAIAIPVAVHNSAERRPAS